MAVPDPFVLPGVAVAVRALAGLVFVVAAAGKMRRWPGFGDVVADYRLLPEVLVPPVVYVLPIVELTIGGALLVGVRTRLAALGAIALLLVFSLAMGVNILRGRAYIDCGCFPAMQRQPLRWALVIRNIVLAMLLGAATAGAALTTAPGFGVDGLLAGGVLFVVLWRLRIF